MHTAKYFLISSLAFVGVMPSLVPAQHTTPRRVIVLIDETDSFGLDPVAGRAATSFWQESKKRIQEIAARLKGGDQFVLCSIDENSFENSNVRIPILTVDPAFLRARMQLRQLRAEITRLQPQQERYRATDIVGALKMAAYFTNSQPALPNFIFCFSDMKQEPRMPAAGTQLEKFAAQSHGYFLYVDGSNWQTSLTVWQPILRAAGLDLGSQTRPAFYLYGNSADALKQILDDQFPE
jgi:hypothetical protein